MIVRWSLVLSVLALSLFGQSTVAEPDKRLTETLLDFTLRFTKVQQCDNITRIISPTCLVMVVAAIQQGAGGNSSKQIDALLGIGRESSKSYFRSLVDYVENSLSGDVFHWGNRLYVRNDLKIDSDYQQNIEKNFKMISQEVDFSGIDFTNHVNDWISQITDNSIPGGINPALITPETYLLFVSAISFTDEWDTPFNVRDTEEDSFYINETTNVTVPFMIFKNRETIAGENKEVGYKWIRLGYSKSKTMFIVFVLPTNRFGLNELTKKINLEDLYRMIRENKTENVNIAIPKFNISSHSVLQPTLRKLGVVDIFTQEANLSDMMDSGIKTFVRDISHNCRVGVNEKGTTAAAVASANFQFLSGSVDYGDNVEFKADEPFMFFLFDDTIEFPHFIGHVFSPLDYSGEEEDGGKDRGKRS